MEVTVGCGTILAEKYRVESVLGRGGMGIVLKVTHLHLGEELAIKVLLPEGAIRSDLTARFLREAQAVVRLRGEHVARVTDIGVLPEGLPFIVMEYLHGVDLSHDLQRRTNLSPGTAVDYVLQACEALAEAHAQGIVHRDIKPANLFLTTRPDGTPLIKVLDFGISKAPIRDNSALTQTEVVMGTPGYMSPEQMKATRDVDARTDIWALGIVLYECLTGRRPFDGESFSATVLMAGTEPPPPMNPEIPRGLQAVVLRCLEKNRKARFPTIAELVAALVPFARNQREAATIAERTSLMTQRPSRASALALPATQDSVSTTLSGSASSGLRPRRRGAASGGIWLLAAVGLLSGAGVMIFSRLHAGPPPDSASAPPEAKPPVISAAPTGTPAVKPLDDARPATSAPQNVSAGAAQVSPPSNAAQGVPAATHGSDAGLEIPAKVDGNDAGLEHAVAHASDAGSTDAALDGTHRGSTTTADSRTVPGSSGEKPPEAVSPPVPLPPRPTHTSQSSSSPRAPRSQIGVIVVRMKSSWAQVWIDGQETGTTPVRTSVPVGPHKVLLVGEGHREQTTVTVIGGGESVVERSW
jgi:serine/threonine protein kinase